MSQVKFSILVPTFKKTFLKECIDSILSQDYHNFEIIIVNDNSPEDIDTIVDSYNDNRIKYYKNETGFGGKDVVNNWNKCLFLSSGEYVICMGDDDILKEKALSLYINAIMQYPEFNILHIRTEIINERNEIIDIQSPRPLIESVYSMIWNLWKGRDQFIGDYLFKASTLKGLGGFYYLPYAWSSDKISTFLVAQENGIVNINTIGFSYLRTNLTISNSCTTQRERYEALLGEKEWYCNFIKSIPPIKDEIDFVYFKLIKKNYISYMNKRLDSMLQWDLNDSPSHITYWLKKKNEYGFSLVYCLRIINRTIASYKTKILKAIFHHY